MSKRAWADREYVGKFELDKISDGKKLILKAFVKTWPDKTKCIDIMKYVIMPDGKQALYQPIQHIQIPYDLAADFLIMFNPEDSLTVRRTAKYCRKHGDELFRMADDKEFMFCETCGKENKEFMKEYMPEAYEESERLAEALKDIRESREATE